MRIRKRKNKKKKVNGFSYPAPFIGSVIVAVCTALAYSYLGYSCEILGRNIKVMEKERVELKKRYVNEECRWMEEKAPAKIEAALRRHNIVMDWPTVNQVVVLRTPSTHKQNIASLGAHSGLAGTVMND
jgi:hypothetical protein